MSNRSRNWLVTINAIPDGISGLLSETFRGKCRYCVFGRECAPSTGHEHVQGFVMFKNAVSFNRMRSMCVSLGAPDLRPGDQKAVAMMQYCKKEGRIILEYGVPPVSDCERGRLGGNAKAVNFKRVTDLAMQGRFERIRLKYPKQYLQYYRTLQSIHKDRGARPEDLDAVCGIWIYGPAGAGKSHYARAEYGPRFYDKACNKWWDNYQGEEMVLIDDFDKRHEMLSHYLKRWADRYAFSGEIKGSQINLRPKKVVVTSQYRISEIWEDEEIRDALNRRFLKIKIHIDSQGNRVIQNQGF